MPYPPEALASGIDDGTIVKNADDFARAVVGHRIVKAEQVMRPGRYDRAYEVFVITLDDGHEVELLDTSDCCAYTELESFLLHADKIDHVITGVGTTDGYTTWHVFADFGDVVEMRVGWSCGNPFYYGYGFDIRIKPDNPDRSDRPDNHDNRATLLLTKLRRRGSRTQT